LEPWCAHHPVFRNPQVTARKQKGRFCRHFSREVVSYFRSWAEISSSARLFARLSPAARIPFQLRRGLNQRVLHHPVLRNLDIRTCKHEAGFCGHFSRVVVSDLRSDCGERPAIGGVFRLRHFSRDVVSDFRSPRGDIVLGPFFGASVSGDKNPVPNSKRVGMGDCSGCCKRARCGSNSAYHSLRSSALP
jgi:hypothetical protein